MESVPKVLNVGPADIVEKDKVPDPLVVSAWPLEPSETLSADMPTALSAMTFDVIFVFATYEFSSLAIFFASLTESVQTAEAMPCTSELSLDTSGSV
jgi:hypothetical protein